LHVLKSLHFCVQVEVFDVDPKEFRVFGGDDTVEEDFCSVEVGNGRVGDAWVIDQVAPDCESDSVRVFFLGSICCHDT